MEAPANAAALLPDELEVGEEGRLLRGLLSGGAGSAGDAQGQGEDGRAHPAQRTAEVRGLFRRIDPFRITDSASARGRG